MGEAGYTVQSGGIIQLDRVDDKIHCRACGERLGMVSPDGLHLFTAIRAVLVSPEGVMVPCRKCKRVNNIPLPKAPISS